MQTFVTIIAIILFGMVLICLCKTGEYFNTLLKTDKYKSLIAWDMMILFFVLIFLVFKIIT